MTKARFSCPAWLKIAVGLGQNLLNSVYSNGFILAAGLHFDGRPHRGAESHHTQNVPGVTSALAAAQQDDRFGLLHGTDKSRGNGRCNAGMR